MRLKQHGGPGDDGRLLLGLRHGSHLAADHVILALGPPATVVPWSGFESPPSRDKLVVDPWVPGSLDVIGPEDRVLLVGTGLTMVDVALSRIFTAFEPIDLNFGNIPFSARELVAAIRDAATKAEFAGEDWRSVVAAVRETLPSP